LPRGRAQRRATLRLGLPSGADAGMENGFQIGTRAGVGKYDPGQFRAIQSAVRGQHQRAEPLPYLLQRGLAGFGQLARNLIGVRHFNAALPEQLAGG